MDRRVRVMPSLSDGSMSFNLVDAETGETLESYIISVSYAESYARGCGWTVVEEGTCLHCRAETEVDIDFHKCKDCT